MDPREPVQQEPHQYAPHQRPIHPQQMQEEQMYNQKPRHKTGTGLEKGAISQKVQQLLIFLYSAISLLLTARFILSLVGARVSTPFVNFVYQFTFPLVSPFANMFGTTLQAGQYRIEFESLVALLVYAILFIGIAKLIGIIFD
jgi:uncharacterized protein YggT (Ycf19 family)